MIEAKRPIRNITVYCSASRNLNPYFYYVAREFGSLLATSGRSLVYGGGSVGMMGAIAESCRDAGGHVTGIITKRLMAAEQLDPLNQENIVVDTMRQRKALLEERGDAMVVLPGGLGTLEEFFEILVGRLLGEHDKPILILNPRDPDDTRDPDIGYFDPLMAMFDHIIESRFAHEAVRELFTVQRTGADIISWLDRHEVSAPRATPDRSHMISSPARKS